MGVPTRMLGLLTQMISWCSCISVKGEEEFEGYAAAETHEVRNDVVSRADIMAASNAAAQRLSSFKHRRTGSIIWNTLVKELEAIPEAHGPQSAGENDCPEEDATVLVKLDTTSAIPAAQPLKPPTVGKQAQYVTPTPAVAINEESQGPATPCQGASRAVSRTDSNTSVSCGQFETGRFSDAAPAEPCSSTAAATPAPKAAQEEGPTTAAAKAEAASEAVASKPVNASASAAAAALPVVATELVAVITANQPDSSAAAVPSSTAGSNNDASISNGSLSCGIVTEKNSREYQEDRAVAAVLTGSDELQNLRRAGFAGVFDGHGGSEAAEHLHQQAIPVLLAQLQLTADPQAAMKAMTEQLEAELLAAGCTAGSTMTAALVADDKIITANVGDSRVVLCRGGQAVQLTRDHKPSGESEAARIKAADPCADISSDGYCYGMAVSRALGSSRLKKDAGKKAFTADADVVEHQLQADDDFLVLASDGLFDCMRNSEIITTARRVLAAQPGDCTAAARALVDRAVVMGSSDNTTAVVVLLHNKKIVMPKTNSRLFKNHS